MPNQCRPIVLGLSAIQVCILPCPRPPHLRRILQAYQDLCLQHRTFRERSENADAAAEITLQPWHAFRPDGVILFSDILTPLTAMDIPFDVLPGRGPVIDRPVRTYADIEAITSLDAPEKTPFVGEALTMVAETVGSEAAVLGFAGAPYTLASYIVEGRNSKSYSTLKRMVFWEPKLLHTLLDRLVDNVVAYLRYQADNGAQARAPSPPAHPPLRPGTHALQQAHIQSTPHPRHACAIATPLHASPPLPCQHARQHTLSTYPECERNRASPVSLPRGS